MNLQRLFKSYGTTGTVTRETFDMLTGQPQLIVAQKVRMAVPLRTTNNQPRLAADLPTQEIDVLIEEKSLVSSGFPGDLEWEDDKWWIGQLPLRRADLIGVNGLELSIIHAFKHTVRGSTVWIIKATGL